MRAVRRPEANAQRPGAAAGFGDVLSPCGSRLVAAFQQPAPDHLAMQAEVRAKFTGPHAVGARCAVVALHGAKGGLPVPGHKRLLHHFILLQHGCPFVGHARSRVFLSPPCLARLHRRGLVGSLRASAFAAAA